jgi:hypothetical protein
MDQVVASAASAFTAIEAADRRRMKPLLHPYLHWTGHDGHTVRRRTGTSATGSGGR